MSTTRANGSTVIEPNFDSVARLYRWAEYMVLGNQLQRTRTEFLSALDDTKRVLVLGDGDGRFSAALLRRNGNIHMTALDSSEAMLRLLARRCERIGASHRVRLVHDSVKNARAATASELFEAVATHFFLDCFSQAEVERLVGAIACDLPPGALWIVSDFAIPPRQPWRLLGWCLVRGLYLAFRVLTGLRAQRLPQPAVALRSAGFHLERRRLRLRGLLYSEVWRFGSRVTAGSVTHPTQHLPANLHPPKQ